MLRRTSSLRRPAALDEWSPSADRANWRAVVWWTLVYGANLIVPYPLGVASTRQGGAAGMHVAVGLIWLVGAAVCARMPRVGGALRWGGGAVAFTQLFPMLQIFAGSLAIAAWEFLCPGVSPALNRGALGSEPHPGLAELGGFVVTHLTAYPLILLALAVGFVFRGLHTRLTHQPVENMPDEAEAEPVPSLDS